MARKKTKPPKITFSKRLALALTALFILTWAVGWVVWIIRGELPDQMLSFVSAPFSVIITGYFMKSGVENYEKIKGSHVAINAKENERSGADG